MLLKKLKKHIDSSGIKQQKVAEILNITPQHLSGVINERIPLSSKLEEDIRKLIN